MSELSWIVEHPASIPRIVVGMGATHTPFDTHVGIKSRNLEDYPDMELTSLPALEERGPTPDV